MYAIYAPRNVREKYYIAEYGEAGAARLLAAEIGGAGPVRTMGGTAARTCGLYRRKATADAAARRLLVMAAGEAGRADLEHWDNVIVGRAKASAFAAVRGIRPLA